MSGRAHAPARELIQPSCRFCKPLAYRGDDRPDEDMRRFFCFGKRDEPSPVSTDDKHNFCIYTPFKGVIQFHVNQGDLDWWLALFLAAWREVTGKKEIYWPAIESMASMLKVDARARRKINDIM